MEALRTEGLSKYFGGVAAIKNVSFVIEAGQKVAIIGPNGAGKTTLFNLLNGQYKPTSGHIFLFGQEITNLPTYSRAHLGQSRSFQITSLCSDLSVYMNALLAAQGIKSSRFQLFRSITSYGEITKKAEEILSGMNLWEVRNNLVKELGYGEQRRLEIALSLASEPKILLLDEPSCGLTPEESIDMITLIHNLGEKLTIVVVAHDMDLVFDVAERIIVLHYGEIIVDGTPAEIQNNPKVKEIYMGTQGKQYNA